MQETSKSAWTGNQLMNSKSYEIKHYKDVDFKTVNLHSHDFYELYFFVNGDASYIIDNYHYKLQAGDIMLISPQNLHQLDINDSSKTYERYVLWINPRFIKKLSTVKTDLATCFNYAKNSEDYLIRDFNLSETVKNLLVSLYKLDDSKNFGDDILSESIIRELLLTIAKYIQSGKNTTKKATIMNPTVTSAINYIDQHISENLSLDTICENLFISKFHLSRLFKDETNTTLHQYILKKRLILSKQLIEQGNSIVSLYQKCGFTDYSHFFRAFKQEYGITPKQYYSLINY